MSRTKLLLLIGGALLFLCVVCGFIGLLFGGGDEEPEAPQVGQVEDASVPPTSTPLPTPEPIEAEAATTLASTPTSELPTSMPPTPTAPSEADTAPVVEAPEVSGGVEPFGLEATEANRALVEGQTVTLETDVSETDRFGRLLRYVYLPDGRMVNEELLRRGMASVATFPPDVKYVDRFRAVEAEARAGGVGLWAEQAQAEPLTTAAPVPQQPSGGGSLLIVDVNKSDEYVDIRNASTSTVDLAGWRLLSERGNQDCALGGAIEPGQTLRIWALSEDAGQGGFNCGFGSNIWNNSESDPAILFDPGGVAVSRFD
jgi:micrococcal nuclease